MQITDKQSTTLSVVGADITGASAVIPEGSVVTFSSSDNTVFEVVTNSDGTTTGKGVAVGTATVVATLTLPNGTVLSASASVEVVSSEIASISIKFSDPV